MRWLITTLIAAVALASAGCVVAPYDGGDGYYHHYYYDHGGYYGHHYYYRDRYRY
jgi:hypothetical protein